MSRLILALLIALGGACSRHAGAAPGQMAVQDTTLRDELLRRVATDQAVREQVVAAGRVGKEPDSALIARLHSVDAENTRWLARTVARVGWPGHSMVGADGADAAFVLVQHADADTAFQARVLPLLDRAYHAREATGQQLALLTDRLETARGRLQVYGTQVDLVAGRAVLKPILDSAGVDTRRAAVGLPPLREYLRLIDSVYFGRPQRTPADRP